MARKRRDPDPIPVSPEIQEELSAYRRYVSGLPRSRLLELCCTEREQFLLTKRMYELAIARIEEMCHLVAEAEIDPAGEVWRIRQEAKGDAA